ncbi:hypothetical protein AURDEDRAFT_169809 [Auricularia subglabra TFB-10046 SS5]|nr:hypothetical protein AURDEDRAFT_169809 [Auricularia subglabra TFB-10046 SS5]
MRAARLISLVRPLVSSEYVIHASVKCIEASFDASVAVQHQHIVENGKRTVYAFDKRKAIAVQRDGESRIRTYALIPAPESHSEHSDAEEAISTLLARFGGWAAWLRELIQLGEPKHVHIIFDMFACAPVMSAWEKRN